MSMDENGTIFVVGAGAVGMPLAVHLSSAGRNVLVVRASRDDVARNRVPVAIRNGADRVAASVEAVSLSRLSRLDGIVVVTAKAYANQAIAAALKGKTANGPLVIMQNGVGVEKPFLEGTDLALYRCVLYVTGQRLDENELSFRSIASSAIGRIRGSDAELQEVVQRLSTPEFPFHAEADIQKQVWKKAIVNAVFNSICPLLEVDNGVFARGGEAAKLAKEVIRECLQLTAAMKIALTEKELTEQVTIVSKGSDGQLISTLQDIRSGKETEIDALNLEMSRIAGSMEPPIDLRATDLLGRLIRAKAAYHRVDGGSAT